MKKKIFSALLAGAVLISSFCVYADAEYKAYNGNVYVSGTSDSDKVTIMLVNKSAGSTPTQEQIKYFTEIETDKDGNYSLTFPYDESIDISAYEVRESSGLSKDVATLTSPGVSDLIDIDVSLLKNGTYAGLIAQLENYYSIDVSGLNIRVFGAFYDRDEKQLLAGVHIYDLANTDINDKIAIPEGAEKMKCFVWQGDDFKAVKTQTVKSVVTDDTFVINCWGDSLTEGAGGSGTTYPGYLAGIIGENASVINHGVGGENTRTIAGRQGGVPFTLSNDITIPATVTPVNIELMEGNPFAWGHINGHEGVNSCVIDGVEGSITRPSEGHPLTFTRSSAGSAKTVTKGTQIITAGSQLSSSGDINIIFTGANDISSLNRGVEGATKRIVGLQKAMADKIENDGGKYLIVGVADGEVSSYSDTFRYLERQQEVAFGKFYLNLRETLTDEGIYGEESVSLSAADITAMNSGNVPSSIIYTDNVHFNAKGYKVVARAIYNKLVSLGWVIGE